MRKKVDNRRSKAQRFREIEQALTEAGWLGLRVAGVASKIGKSKSYTHKLLLEMVDGGLVERRIEYTDNDNFFVNYCYYQLPLFDSVLAGSSYDGLKGECTMCGIDFSGSADGMCSSCRQVWNG